MPVQEIDLSPRKILSYLKDLENKLPQSKYKAYAPSMKVSSVTEDLLNNEVRRMMDFVGLKGYEPICTLCKTEEGTGGCVDMTNTKDNLLRISVSEEYHNNIPAALAVLAHEVCHKYLFVNGIYVQLVPIMNEVYCDLCTIYVGFGDLILNGYNTTTGNTRHILGYLKPYVYNHAYKITKVLLDGKEELITEDFAGDYFLYEAFATWKSSSDKRKVFLDTFADTQNEYSELNRNILLLHQILDMFKENYKGTLAMADDYFFGRGDFFEKDTNRLLKPINAFAAIYENEPSKDIQEMVDESNTMITNLMVKLADSCKYFDIGSLKYLPYSCPFCGTESQNTSFDGRKAIVRCNKCGKHFHINCEHWNIAGKRKEIKEREEREKQERNRINSYNANQAYQRGYAKAKSEDLNLEQLPKWLKWIIRKYVS